MKSRDFAYWLKGYLELGKFSSEILGGFSGTQVECIERHLNMVFAHEIDPSFGDDNVALNGIHNPLPHNDGLIKC